MAEEKENAPQEKKKQIDYDALSWGLNAPVNTEINEFISVDDVRKKFGLPVTQGMDKDTRLGMDKNNVAFDTMFQSLTQHAIQEGQYPMSGFVGYAVLQQIAQNGMIRTCIQTVADDITREWIELTGGKNDSDDKLEKLEDVFTQNHVKSLINKAVAKTGYYGGCFIYIDTGTDDPSLPLVINSKSAEIKKDSKIDLVIIDPINVSPMEYNSINPLKKDYMKPRMWSVQGQPVHASRLITFTDNEPPMLLKPNYNFLGIPQAQILWDYVLHWNKSRTNAVNILDKLNLTVYKTSMSDVLAAENGIQLLDVKIKALQRYRNNNSVLVCDNEVESIENISQVISGATDIVRQALEFIAAINRTPAVKLLGISPSGFNSTGESDIRNYYDHVKAKQELYRDQIQTLINIYQLICFGEIDETISFKFKEIGGDDLANNVKIFKTQVDSLTALQNSGVIDNAEAREFVRTSEISGLDFLSEDVPEQPNPEDMQTMNPEQAQKQPEMKIDKNTEGLELWQKKMLS